MWVAVAVKNHVRYLMNASILLTLATNKFSKSNGSMLVPHHMYFLLLVRYNLAFNHVPFTCRQ